MSTICPQTRSASIRGTLTEPGTAEPLPRPAHPKRATTCSAACATGEFEDGRAVCCGRKYRHGRPATSICAIRWLYRILDHAHHPRTGDAWCIYPTYDFAHGQSDAIEGVTHSLCTLEFADHRPLYDWLIENACRSLRRPRQYEFARLNISYTVLSKRRADAAWSQDGHVKGWDDPRMPTLSGPAAARRAGGGGARNFVSRLIGVTKSDSTGRYGAVRPLHPRPAEQQ